MLPHRVRVGQEAIDAGNDARRGIRQTFPGLKPSGNTSLRGHESSSPFLGPFLAEVSRSVTLEISENGSPRLFRKHGPALVGELKCLLQSPHGRLFSKQLDPHAVDFDRSIKQVRALHASILLPSFEDLLNLLSVGNVLCSS